MNKQYILNEIKRTAEANGGVPLGEARFATETGVKATDWRGKYWVRYGDLVREAGYTPNRMNQPYPKERLIQKLIEFIREVGRFPVPDEIRLKAYNDPDFPSHNTFNRLGSTKRDRILRILEYCQQHGGFKDIVAICEAGMPPAPLASDDDSPGEATTGFVYLLQSGRYYKIGRSNAAGRRERELAIQLPEKAKLVHEIRTDDPIGIEAYWHGRFESQRQNGEWFALSSADVKVFKRRKFM